MSIRSRLNATEGTIKTLTKIETITQSVDALKSSAYTANLSTETLRTEVQAAISRAWTELAFLRNQWLEVCERIYGDPELPRTLPPHGFRLATTSNIVDFGKWQAALWYKGSPVAIYQEWFDGRSSVVMLTTQFRMNFPTDLMNAC